MDFSDFDSLFHWFDVTVQLLQRLFVVVVAALIAIRFEWLRRALRGAELAWSHRLTAMAIFGALAIIGTHSGVLIDMNQNGLVRDWLFGLPTELTASQTIISFRNTMVLAAGLMGGPWVGLGAGLLAGVERYGLGGFSCVSSSLWTLLLGGYAGCVRYFRPDWIASAKGVFWVTLLGTLIYRLFLIVFVDDSYPGIAAMSWLLLLPIAAMNSLGCLLFFWVMRDLDRDRLLSEAQTAQVLALQVQIESDRIQLQADKAELRALHAQVEPHFLNNTLNAIHTLISIEPNKAAEYLGKLARFMNDTRQTACANSVTIEQELSQLARYLDFQQLRFPGKFAVHEDVPTSLLAYQILPRSLQTLAENALLHGLRGHTEPLHISITAEEDGGNLLLCVTDNGCGIAPERLAELGQQAVHSAQGSGSALYQINQSLHLAFNGEANLAIHSQLGLGTKVIMTLPKRSETW
jgi:two-component system sensor histidine kinase LytS